MLAPASAASSSSARPRRSHSPVRSSRAQQGLVPRSGLSPLGVSLCLVVLLLLLLLRNPSCRSALNGGMGSAAQAPVADGGHLVSRKAAEELNRLILHLQRVSASSDSGEVGANGAAADADTDTDKGAGAGVLSARPRGGAGAGASSIDTVFSAANTAFRYHSQQRAALFLREKLHPEMLAQYASGDKAVERELHYWTEARMREVFLAPSYSCPTEIRIGEWGVGGAWLCNIFPFRRSFRALSGAPLLPPPHADGSGGFRARLDSQRPLVVWSVGWRGDTSFESAVSKLLSVRPVLLDPGLREAKQHQVQALPFLHFVNAGLTGKTKPRGRGKGSGPALRFAELLSLLNTSYVDVLRLDCQSCEADVARDLLETYGRQPPLGQVLMQIHQISIPHMQIETLMTMEKLGFRMFHSENNERYSKAHEVAYIHESLVDPALWPQERRR